MIELVLKLNLGMQEGKNENRRNSRVHSNAVIHDRIGRVIHGSIHYEDQVGVSPQISDGPFLSRSKNRMVYGNWMVYQNDRILYTCRFG